MIGLLLRILSLISKFKVTLTLLSLLTFSTLFLIWQNPTQENTKKAFEIAKSSTTVTELLNNSEFYKHTIMTSSTSVISFADKENVDPSSDTVLHTFRNNRFLMGAKKITVIEFQKYLTLNSAFLKSKNSISIVVMPSFPYRGSFEIHYDQNLKITEVTEPRYYD